jgi:hypothetical protein
MSESITTIHLHPSMFTEKERILVNHGSLSASVFRFNRGVSAIKLSNEKGFLVLLPYQGMQIWSANFLGRELTMKSNFDEPRPTQVYLENYGGFLIHCGATAMGVPTKEDTHPLHGELPNAPYEKADLIVGTDENGDFIALSGTYHHVVAFNHNYTAEPTVRLHENSSLFEIHMQIENLKNTPMELMYLAHINFRPVNDSHLVYSANCTPEHVRVRKSIPSHIKPAAGYPEFIQELGQHPEKHHQLAPDLAFDPEVVFTIDYETDANGWAHSLQVHPDGESDYVGHKPSQLGKGVRWICRTPDQDALGLVLPATAEPEGYSMEKAKGNIQVLGPKSHYEIDIIAGALPADQTREIEMKIEKILHS